MICVACHKKGGSATDKCPFCGTPYTEASKAKFSDEFHLSMDKEAVFDFHVKNIDLDFDMECVHRMNKALGIGKSADYGGDDDETELPVDEIHAASTTGDESEGESEEADGSEEDHVVEIPPSVKKVLRISGWVILFLLLAAFLWGIFFYIGTWQPFQKALAEGNYVEAVEIYDRSDNSFFRKRAEAALSTQADRVLEDYRTGKISGQEARTQLDALSMVSGSSQNLSDVYSEAAEIERSRKSYQEGLILYQAGDYVGAMEAWSGLSEKDSASCEEVKKLLSDEKVKTALDNEIVSQVNGTGSRSSSGLLQALVSLQNLLPDFPNLDQSISSLEPLAAQEFVDNGLGNGMASDGTGERFDLFTENVVIDRSAPVYIKQIRTARPNVEGGIDLFIRWVNRSGRTISRIVFVVKPTNEFGTEIGCRKQGYSTYYAIDKGPYENGQGTPTDTWKWSNAWYNPLIAKAELLSVYIEYADGTSDTITDSETLQKLLVE